jgi:ADP-heptose:LPS heptosyltransferase
MQTSSSDEKKNWPLLHWKNLLEKVSRELPDYQVKLIGNQKEVHFLKQHFQFLPPQVSIEATTIAETYSLLKTSSLIVTLDTAIKHLATWTQTPIIEIALGSSDPGETGAYQTGSLIVQSTAPCSPCSHSRDCHQTNFICHEQIDSEVIWPLIANKLKPEIGSFSENIQNGRGYRVGSVSQNRELRWQLMPINQSREVQYAGRNQSSIDQHCKTP